MDSRNHPLLNSSMLGYAHHRIILDDGGQPFDYEFIEVNATFEKMTGLKAEKLMGRTVRQAIPGIEKSQFDWIGFYGEVALHGGEKEFEQFSEHLGRWYRVHVVSTEKFTFTTIFLDITTDKKQTEEIETFFRVNLDLLCIADLEGHFVKTNEAWGRILGYSTEELNTKKFLEFVHPDDMPATIAAMADLGKGEDVLRFTNRYRCKDGSYRFIEWRSHPKGQLIYAAARDVTERHLAEEKLRESEAKLNALFDAMTEMVVLHELVFDGDAKPVNYRITDCNKAYSIITGITRENAVGRLATEVYGTSEPPYLKEFSEVALSGQPTTFEIYYPPMEKFFFISVVSPEKNCFATVTTDITRQKRTERAMEVARKQLEAKNKELEQLVFVASHDLRSPLVNVDGFSRELEYSVHALTTSLEADDEATLKNRIKVEFPDMIKSIQRVRASARQMDNLLNALLKLSRIGRSALQIKTLDMNELLGHLALSFAFRLKEGGIKLTVEPLLPCLGDAVQVTQVFSNLIDNAIKYLDGNRPGVITLGCNIDGHRVKYSVEDNGLGIDPRHQEKIFELFNRIHQKDTDGEGIGLTMVRQILGRMNGIVTVESTLNSGSKFIVSLPTSEEN